MAVISRGHFLRYLSAALPWLTGVGLHSKTVEPQHAAALHMAKIPSTGEILPRIGLGTYSTFDVGMNSPEILQVHEVLAEFHRLGGRLIDSSPMYGEAEAVTGSVSAQLGLGDEFFMATKVWTSGRERGVQQIKDSLRKLRRTRLELMQIHNLVDWKAHLKTLRALKEQGVFRYIGITHYQTSAFGEIAKILQSEPFDFLQIPYSIGETAAAASLRGAESLLDIAAARRIAVIANEPFAQGRLFRLVKGRPVPVWATQKGITSWAQYFLKFILSDQRIQFAIPATRRLDHLRDNMAAGAGYLPDASERARMLADFRKF